MTNSSVQPKAKTRVFTSFDFDHDEDLRMLFVGQARNPRTPFEIVDWSVKEKLPGNWKEKVRERIRRVDKVVVMCGEHTDRATGVSEEVRIAREEKKPCYFIEGRPDKECRLPKSALLSDRIEPWTWDGIAAMMNSRAPHDRPSRTELAQLIQARREAVRAAPVSAKARLLAESIEQQQNAKRHPRRSSRKKDNGLKKFRGIQQTRVVVSRAARAGRRIGGL